MFLQLRMLHIHFLREFDRFNLYIALTNVANKCEFDIEITYSAWNRCVVSKETIQRPTCRSGSRGCEFDNHNSCAFDPHGLLYDPFSSLLDSSLKAYQANVTGF